ncbi:putative GNAT family acetyltransferase [metagenome]|uniref:Putative GNAT family acetyltransferase n=1 Tax=metagenome TaxID=256318 RepID=A0A2P2BWV3_9ZZZZ
MDVRRVAPDEWDIVAWLWQAFRNDLAAVVGQSYPRPDGRYRHERLERYPGTGREGWLAWAPHPQLDVAAPIGFALVDAIGTPQQSLAEFFVVPAARRGRVGRRFAAHVLAQHPAPWTVAFQHDNVTAGRFWRAVFTEGFGDDWAETEEAVPDKPHVPPDHWIRTR